MSRYVRFICAAWIALAAGVAQAGEPTAMVEEVSGARGDLELMDYLEAGRSIELMDGERLVLGYFLSCVHETIVGGIVTIGRRESTVDGGTVERAYPDCDGGSVVLAEGLDQEAGAAAFRGEGSCTAMPPPDRILYDVSPLIRFRKDSGPLTITRLCPPETEAPITVQADGQSIDLRSAGLALAVGSSYRIEGAGRTVVVKISRLAEPNRAALISRLLPL